MPETKQNPEPPLRYRIIQKMMWPVLKPLHLSCRHFSELCSVRLDRPLTQGEKVRFRIHRMSCGLCRSLPKQMECLGVLSRGASYPAKEDDEPAKSLPDEARQRILRTMTKGTDNDGTDCQK